MYKTVVIGYASKADTMEKKVEEKIKRNVRRWIWISDNVYN